MMIPSSFKSLWARFWMRFAGLSPFGKIAARFAAWFVPPYKSRQYLAYLNPKGYISPRSLVHHDELTLGNNIFIGDRVVIYKNNNGGPVKIGRAVNLHNDVIIEVGEGGTLTIGPNSSVQPRCQFSAYKAPIRIGSNVQIAPHCAFYPYNHALRPGESMTKQPLQTKGGIVVDDDAWLGFGVIVLDGVRIGKGAVIGAGSVVTRDIPDGAVAVGVPARVIKMRSDMPGTETSESRHSGAIS